MVILFLYIVLGTSSYLRKTYSLHLSWEVNVRQLGCPNVLELTDDQETSL